jgi:hypothetical protein
MATTFTKIASVTVGSGGASSIDFTSIPGTYTDLCVKLSARMSNSELRVRLSFNGSASGYSENMIYTNESTGPFGASNSGAYIIWTYADGSGNTANTFNSADFYIPNYAGSNNKSVSIDNANEQNGTVNQLLNFTAGLWANSAAITSINLTNGTGNFVQYSTATLYGIKNS